ncbi:MAG: ABC transporter ATP-binding protein [Acidobacteriota bacterium]
MTEATRDPLSVELCDVHKSYEKPDGSAVPVLSDLDLRVRGHQLISLVGPSGCGKSTLFRLLLGMEPPTRGTVKVGGEVVERPDQRRGIVFQNYSLFPHLTVLENVIFGLELAKVDFLSKWLLYPRYRRRHKEFAAKGLAFLERFRLGEHASKYPHELSGGMRQRVAIAQAMIMEPQLLLLDEPFGALDDDIRRQCQIFLDELFMTSKMTVLFVTHNVYEAALLADRVLVLSPFYRTQNPGAAGKAGSRFVFDVAVDAPRPRSAELESSKELSDLVREIRERGLDPARIQDLRDFKLSHPDSYRTIDPAELGEGEA